MCFKSLLILANSDFVFTFPLGGEEGSESAMKFYQCYQSFLKNLFIDYIHIIFSVLQILLSIIFLRMHLFVDLLGA